MEVAMLSIRVLPLVVACSLPCEAQELITINRDDIILPNGLVLRAQDINNDILNQDFIKELESLTNDLQEMEAISKDLGWEIKRHSENLTQIQDNTDHTKQTLERTNETLTEAKEVAKKNRFLSFLIKDGVSLGAGAGIGSIGFLGTKSLLMLIPAIPTATAIAIPLTIAAVGGGVTYLVSRYQLSKVI
jgi:hypothetical protein